MAREAEVWIARVRLLAIVFAIVQVGLFSEDSPEGYETYAWIITAIFAAGAIALFFASSRANVHAVGIVALVFDVCVIGAYATLYSYEYGSPTRWASGSCPRLATIRAR